VAYYLLHVSLEVALEQPVGLVHHEELAGVEEVVKLLGQLL